MKAQEKIFNGMISGFLADIIILIIAECLFTSSHMEQHGVQRWE